MAANVTEADEYIGANCIVIEDWTDADEASKGRILNVAGRTLARKYPKYTIPDAAAYEFANVLATAYNDTNKLARQGIEDFALNLTVTVGFKADLVVGPDADLAALIPQVALDLIGAENGVVISKRGVKWTVL
ncbi:hypothetical protein BBD42_15605 [Paenibacillus sp. BIHB 4019]|uniref:Uncharacterized protein n=1 Tax=Paenibacillus sp. BIHB 4019 TaxID=1870819 RepID=A0A1B2DJ33_9BACL|nr:hypothetical protein [Paenibacillus sp. BIHB 4019]ANY67732.1 hypothetical protein BBD42_15605 [Paenibacillus sp. BIHB 4019]